MKNLKDIATTIAGVMGFIAVAIVGLIAKGVVLPAWITTVGIICGALSPIILGYFGGKNADGTTKTPEQLASK